MIKPIKILLTTAGASTDTFSLFSDADGFVTSFATGITKAQLLAGYISSVAPDFTSVVRVKSNSACMNSIDLDLSYIYLEFRDINFALQSLSITDRNNVLEWNENLANDARNWYVTNVNFTRVEVNQNTVKLFGNLSQIDYLTLYNTTLISVNFVSQNATLKYLDFYTNYITDFNPIFVLPNTMTELYLAYNQIITFNPTLPLPSSLTTLDLKNNKIIEFNPTIQLPESLLRLELGNLSPSIFWNGVFDESVIYGNHIQIFNPSILPSGLAYLDLQGNDITNTNQILAYFVSVNRTGLTLYLQEGANVAPTGQGLIDKQTLIDNGNTIITN